MSLNAASISTVLCKYLTFAERGKIVKQFESDGGKHVGPLPVPLDAGIKVLLVMIKLVTNVAIWLVETTINMLEILAFAALCVNRDGDLTPGENLIPNPNFTDTFVGEKTQPRELSWSL